MVDEYKTLENYNVRVYKGRELEQLNLDKKVFPVDPNAGDVESSKYAIEVSKPNGEPLVVVAGIKDSMISGGNLHVSGIQFPDGEVKTIKSPFDTNSFGSFQIGFSLLGKVSNPEGVKNYASSLVSAKSGNDIDENRSITSAQLRELCANEAVVLNSAGATNTTDGGGAQHHSHNGNAGSKQKGR